MKKWWRFLHIPMPVRQSLRNLQRRGAFTAAFTSENERRLLAIFSSRICQSLYDVKPKAQSELCAQLAVRFLIANYCKRCRCNFKGVSQDGGQADFSCITWEIGNGSRSDSGSEFGSASKLIGIRQEPIAPCYSQFLPLADVTESILILILIIHLKNPRISKTKVQTKWKKEWASSNTVPSRVIYRW